MAQVTVVVMGNEVVYDVLNICEFNSTRKRMSCVVRTPDQRLVLLCKGAARGLALAGGRGAIDKVFFVVAFFDVCSVCFCLS